MYVVTIAFVFISYYIMSKCINFNWVHCYACITLLLYPCIKNAKISLKKAALSDTECVLTLFVLNLNSLVSSDIDVSSKNLSNKNVRGLNGNLQNHHGNTVLCRSGL